jgi:hypothetical protein
VGEKEKGQGPSSKTVIPFLPSVQNRGGIGGGPPAGSGDCRRPGGRRRPGTGEKEKGGEGYLLRCSPWLGTARGGGSAARGGRWWRLLAAARMVVVAVH